MPIWKNPSAAPQKVGVLLFDRFSNHCLANAVEPLRAANTLSRRPLYQWQYLSANGAPVTSSSGLVVSPGARLGAEGPGDVLFVMPSYAFLDHVRPAVQRGLREAAKRYKALAAFDTGSWLLADAGLLDGRRATIHWEELESFRERFPDVTVERARTVQDGNMLTSSGAAAAFDLVLQMIAARHGEALAVDVAALFMQAGAETGFPATSRRYSPAVAKALAIMQEYLEEPLKMMALARKAGLTQRGLETRFRAELGATPEAVYKQLRLGLARKLAEETTLSIAEIAIRCGYANASAMTRAFKCAFGQPPARLRSCFRGESATVSPRQDKGGFQSPDSEHSSP